MKVIIPVIVAVCLIVLVVPVALFCLYKKRNAIQSNLRRHGDPDYDYTGGQELTTVPPGHTELSPDVVPPEVPPGPHPAGPPPPGPPQYPQVRHSYRGFSSVN